MHETTWRNVITHRDENAQKQNTCELGCFFALGSVVHGVSHFIPIDESEQGYDGGGDEAEAIAVDPEGRRGEHCDNSTTAKVGQHREHIISKFRNYSRGS